MVGRLGGGADGVDEGQGGGEVVQLDRRDQRVALAGPVQLLLFELRVDLGQGEHRLPHGCVISSGRTAASNSSPVSSSSSSAASRSVLRSLCAFLATFAALS